jgi:hypothetical protein
MRYSTALGLKESLPLPIKRAFELFSRASSYSLRALLAVEFSGTSLLLLPLPDRMITWPDLSLRIASSTLRAHSSETLTHVKGYKGE